MKNIRRSRFLPRAVGVMSAVVLIAGPAFVVPARAASSRTTYYVSPSGSDANPGTFAAPKRSVAQGLATLSPGDTLYLRGGTYVENITATAIRSGTPSAPISVRNFPGERPVIKGLLWLKEASWWTLDGINVTWNPANPSKRHMVKFTNGVGWTLKNSELWGARSYAALLVAGTEAGLPANWRVTGNCIHDTYASNGTNQDHLIYTNTGTNPGTGVIERNLLFNARNGEGVKLGGPAPTLGGAANVTVRNNTIHNVAQGVLVGWQAHNIAISRNIIDIAGGNYANIRGYQLDGSNVTAANNIGAHARAFLQNDPGYDAIRDAGGNRFPVDPRFHSVSGCDGFRPLNPVASAYGRYGNLRAHVSPLDMMVGGPATGH